MILKCGLNYSFWLGSETACNLLNNPPEISLTKSATRKMYENITEIASEVPVEYRMFYSYHVSTVQFDPDLFNKSILHVGLCFPKACNDMDANSMAKTIFELNFVNNFIVGKLTYIGTKTLNIRKNFLNEPFIVILL